MAEEGKREVREKDIEPGIGDVPEKGIYGISPTIDGDLLEVNSVVPKKEGGLTRRQFIVGTGAAGGLLALTGCVPSPTPPTEIPIVTETTGIPPSPTLEIKTPTIEPTPSPTITREPTVSPEPSPTVQPSPTATKEPTPAQEPCEVERCECYSELALYHNPTEEESFSILVPGTNKTFIVKEREDGWMLIEVREPNGAVWEAWTNDVSGTYGPAGEATPIPEPGTCPSGSETIPPEIGRYAHGELTELVYANVNGFYYPERWFLGEREGIFFGEGRVVKIDLSLETITVETLSGTFSFRFSSQTVFALFNTNTWGWIGTDKCKFQEDDVVRVYVEAPGDGAFMTGIWK